jgi:hypothetical protein
MTNFRHVKVTAQHIRRHRRHRRVKSVFSLIFQLVQYILITAAALVMSFNGNYGQYVIALYGLVIILPKLWPFGYGKLERFIENLGSQQVFTIALLILISIPVFTVLGKNVIVENAAIYVFELLVIGIFTATIELWHGRAEKSGTTYNTKISDNKPIHSL